MVDTGNSYEGLCEYVGGKYISYTEEKPITMNPFRINREELNVEKTGFLKNLVLLIWKGSQGTVSKNEKTDFMIKSLRNTTTPISMVSQALRLPNVRIFVKAY
jgi:type IV secretory pathway VirB4 component